MLLEENECITSSNDNDEGGPCISKVVHTLFCHHYYHQPTEIGHGPLEKKWPKDMGLDRGLEMYRAALK